MVTLLLYSVVCVRIQCTQHKLRHSPPRFAFPERQSYRFPYFGMERPRKMPQLPVQVYLEVYDLQKDVTSIGAVHAVIVALCRTQAWHLA